MKRMKGTRSMRRLFPNPGPAMRPLFPEPVEEEREDEVREEPARREPALAKPKED